MAYDKELAEQIRTHIGLEPDVTEKKMFGGLAFLVNGNMAIAASGHGGLLLRVDPAKNDELIATTKATPMEMGGRTMTGWLRVPKVDDKELTYWVELTTAYARSLPPK